MTKEYDLSPLRVMPKVIEATTFNMARLALKRVANPLRMSLAGHRGLDVILSEDQWQCVDSCHDDLPILVWREFNVHCRETLHLPIECRLYLYHLQAGLIMGTALDSLSDALVQQLREGAGNRGVPSINP